MFQRCPYLFGRRGAAIQLMLNFARLSRRIEGEDAGAARHDVSADLPSGMSTGRTVVIFELFDELRHATM